MVGGDANNVLTISKFQALLYWMVHKMMAQALFRM